MIWKRLAAPAAILLIGVSTLAAPPAPFSAGRAAFAVEVAGDLVPYTVMGLFAMPGEAVSIRVVSDDPAAEFDIIGGPASWTERASRVFDGRAPLSSGLHPIGITERGSGAQLTLHLFVQVPAAAVVNGRLEGYRIDGYPTPLGGRATYQAPSGFVRVTPELAHVRVSPHFTLGQFLAKQNGGFPKFVVLRTALLLKLEGLLEKVNAAGRRADSLLVMSGYRTPYYNRTLGNTPNSRHVFGDAADVFVDADGNGVMDDLDGNGRSDRRDAEWLLRLVDELDTESHITIGGAGPYPATATHGPFVHVDARGTRARW